MISIIAAKNDQSVFGYKNDLPWKCPQDLQNFKRLTVGHTVIYGRRTWESLNRRPLPGRTNIVLSRSATSLTLNFQYRTDKQKQQMLNTPLHVCNNLYAALQFAKSSDSSAQCFVIGGAGVIACAYPFASRIYLTQVHSKLPQDAVKKEIVMFPHIPPYFKLVKETTMPATKPEYDDCTFFEYEAVHGK